MAYAHPTPPTPLVTRGRYIGFFALRNFLLANLYEARHRDKSATKGTKTKSRLFELKPQNTPIGTCVDPNGGAKILRRAPSFVDASAAGAAVTKLCKGPMGRVKRIMARTRAARAAAQRDQEEIKKACKLVSAAAAEHGLDQCSAEDREPLAHCAEEVGYGGGNGGAPSAYRGILISLVQVCVISPYLRVSPHLSTYLPISPHVSHRASPPSCRTMLACLSCPRSPHARGTPSAAAGEEEGEGGGRTCG